MGERLRGPESSIEDRIREMLKRMEVENEPIRTVPISEVPEFGEQVVVRGLVGACVPQGEFRSTTNLPLRTDNVVDCNVFLVRDQFNEEPRTTLVHVWAGDLEMNHEGYKESSLTQLLGSDARAIAIMGDRSAGIVATARRLRYAGVVTERKIEVPSGKKYISVVYRPASDELFVRIGDNEEVQLFHGFNKPASSRTG